MINVGTKNVTCGTWLHTQQVELMTGYADGSLFMHDNLSSNSSLINKFDSAIWKITPHAFQSVVACAHEDGSISMVNTQAKKVMCSIKHGQDPVTSLSFDSSGLMLVSSCHDGSVKVHELKNMQQGQANMLCHL